jgi:excisionase family DNA binding protein
MKTEELDTEVGTQELRYIKPKTIATMMDVSVDTVLSMMHRGELEGVQFGAHWRIKFKSFLDYLEVHRYKKDELETS